MAELVSKTLFQEFLFCPKNLWLKLHKPELLHTFALSEFELHLLEQGNEVESLARSVELFRGGVEVRSSGEERVAETARLMTEKIPAIFQATFIQDGFIVRNDVLRRDAVTGLWDLYEIKASNSIKEGRNERNHIIDIAFQAAVMRRANVPLGRCYHVRLNKVYVRAGDLDIESLFEIEDVTDSVEAELPKVEPLMAAAAEYLNRVDEPPAGCECMFKSRRNQCTTFAYSNPQVPAYSIHDLSRIHKTKLERMVDAGIYHLGDIADPDAFGLTDRQARQVLVHGREPMIDLDVIASELAGLKYPLYFLDYETFPSAVPLFGGYAPYQHIPFQFSLHILREPGGILEHVEYLHEAYSDPSQSVAMRLEEYIRGGTVIVWNKKFEMARNTEMALRLPAYAKFFETVNGSVYDLEDIFSHHHYLHDGFRGSASIKKVLPIVAPDLTYADLEIHEGSQASKEWWRMISPTTLPAEKQMIAEDLKKYCGRDTYAMYVIWKHLRDLADESIVGKFNSAPADTQTELR